MTPCLTREVTIGKPYIMRGKIRTPPSNPTAFWIDAAMETRGIATLRELADIAEVSHARVVQVRNGDSTTRDFIERLAVAFTPKGSDEQVADSILNEGLRAAFPRPEDDIDAEVLNEHEVIDYLRGKPEPMQDKALRMLKAAFEEEDAKDNAGNIGKKAK